MTTVPTIVITSEMTDAITVRTRVTTTGTTQANIANRTVTTLTHGDAVIDCRLRIEAESTL